MIEVIFQNKVKQNVLRPETPVQYLKGVGPRISEILKKREVRTALDFLFYLPVRYIDRRTIHSVDSLPIDKKQSFVAEIVKISVRKLYRRRRKILEMIVSDGKSFAQVSFFQFNEEYLKKKFPIGSTVLFLGDVRVYRGLKTIVHPDMEIWDLEGNKPICPIYPLTEGLYQKTLRRIFDANLENLLSFVEEDPRSVREEGDVKLSLKEALRYVHCPPVEADLEVLNERRSSYHQRIIYDELFYLQLGLLSKRSRELKEKSLTVPETSSLFQKALSLLPFELTSSQKQVLQDIKKDFLSGKPMSRLLQGDVGSGKTIVAFLSGLLIIDTGAQVALMAPTEVLVEQHFQKLLPFASHFGIRIELLTGSTAPKKREQILADLKNGLVHLLVGTHALITTDVQFKNLSFVIIDEQHRFGVLQRAQLKEKSSEKNFSPHFLIMTATPIPRTLSMTVYGDLDLSVMKELPKGRQPILTKVFWEKQRETMYGLIAEEIKKGRQTYFIYPLIEESEKLDLKDATRMYENLCKVFPNHKVGLLHGRMGAKEKEEIMRKFSKGDMAILVSTTVVEVGIDVPNATVMVVEHAERFGLSQLHQLRGRVGRGSEKSFCYLVAGYARSEEARFRLRVMESTQDGFVIAEEDLKLRGPGQFLGTRQSGLPDLHLAELVRDSHLLTAARKRAEEILTKDPELSDPQNQVMKNIMHDRWGKRLELVLV